MSDRPAAAAEEPGPESRLTRLARRLFDRAESRLATSTLAARPALSLAGGIGRLRGALSGRWPAAADVSALFATGALASRRIAGEIAAHEARSRLVLHRTAGKSIAPFAPLVRWRDPAAAARLAGPLILVTGHFGALHLMSPALNRLALRRTVLRWGAQHLLDSNERSSFLAGGLASRTRALLEALGELKEGGVVSTTIDGGNGTSVAVDVLGQRLDVGIGAFALAERSGAAVLPVAALWEHGGVVCELGEPVSTPEQAARWMEGVLRRDPGQISLGLLRRLLFGPPVVRAE